MAKKVVFLFFFVSWFVYSLNGAGEKIIPFPEVNRLSRFAVDGDRLFINERFSISIYSLDDNRLIKKFGSQGEGPREFKVSAVMYLIPDGLVVISDCKISYYTRDGEYIKERRTPLHFYPGAKVLMKDLFVSLKNYVELRKSLWILDADFNPVIEVYREKTEHKLGEVLGNYWIFIADGNRIFSVKDNEFQVGIYDTRGKEVASISRDYERIKFTQEYKGEYFKSLKAQLPRGSSDSYQRIVKFSIFPERLPAISNLFISDNKLYIGTFGKENGKSEVFVYTTDGKFIERKLLPLTSMYDGYLFNYPFTIKDGKLYQFIENGTTGNWELHISELKPK
jgi:hypothetical protein